MRSVEFHPDAQDEFISAAQFYERQIEVVLGRVGDGDGLLVDIETDVDRFARLVHG